jgi:hypothetical protein
MFNVHKFLRIDVFQYFLYICFCAFEECRNLKIASDDVFSVPHCTTSMQELASKVTTSVYL